MATRHQVRQAVITFLYAHEMDTFNEDFASEYFAEQKIKNEQKNFAETLFGGVLENIDNIDEKINSYLSSFKLAELGAMERAILRLGAHEILAQTCEARVAISEAVALASEFGSRQGLFICSILTVILLILLFALKYIFQTKKDKTRIPRI